MAIETIYIARHGYRANWLPPPHPPNPTGIDSDPPLAPHGVDQAVELGNYFGSLPENEKPQFIIASPFYRCVETAQPVAKSLDLKVHLDTGVGEWFKQTRPVIPIPAGYSKLREFFPEVLGSESTWKGSKVVPSPQGEDEELIFARTGQFWEKFFPLFEQAYPDVKRVLFVTHAATKIALGTTLMKLESVFDEFEFQGKKTKLQSGACSVDKYDKDGESWVIVQNGRTDFLTHGEEMNWSFDVKFEAGSDDDIKARKAKKTEYEEVFLTVDIPIVAPSSYDEVAGDDNTQAFSEQLLINPNARFQITRLDEDKPLFKVSNNANAGADPESVSFTNLSAIDGQIYQTNWAKLLGTDLIFDENGQCIGTVREHLVTDLGVTVKPRIEDVAMDSDSEGEKNEVDSTTAFFKRALATAKAKES